MISVKVSSSGKFRSRHAGMVQRARHRLKNGIVAVAETLLDAADELVPKDTEYLFETGRVSEIGSGFDFFAVVGYGGTDWPGEPRKARDGGMAFRKPSTYAVYVHEDLDAFHPVGEAKWLEKAERESTGEMRAALRQAVR